MTCSSKTCGSPSTRKFCSRTRRREGSEEFPSSWPPRPRGSLARRAGCVGMLSGLASSSERDFAMHRNEVIVRWGLAELPGLLEEAGMKRPFTVASDRWSHLDLPRAGRWREVPTNRIGEIADAARGSDGLLAIGGGSALDVAKAVSSATGLRVVSVPTTYSGAEWTLSFPIRDEARRVTGGGSGAHLAGIVYEPQLTLDLPRAASGGTARNALTHSPERPHPAGRNPTGAP